MLNWHDKIDEYCERTDFSFWAEPVNAITNLAIIFAGIMALRLYYKQFPLHNKRHRPNVLILIALVIMIGIGSFLYHTTATIWAGYADVLPIIAFIYLFHAVFLRRILAMRYRYVLMYVLAFFLLSITLMGVLGQSMAKLGIINQNNILLWFNKDMLNGSIGYIPALASFLIVWVSMLILKRPGTRRFRLAAIIFVCSVTFRSIDMNICSIFPIGTHFLWHILNSVVLYILLSLVILLPNFYQWKQEHRAFMIGR